MWRNIYIGKYRQKTIKKQPRKPLIQIIQKSIDFNEKIYIK